MSFQKECLYAPKPKDEIDLPDNRLNAINPDYAIEEAIKYLFITKSYRFSL